MVQKAVTRGLNLLLRHGFVARFQFLKAGDVGPGLFEPFDQARQARLDPVDVEGRDFHRPAMAGTRRLRKASDREARPAAAAGGGVGIFDLERRSAERIDEIDRAAANEVAAERIDDRSDEHTTELQSLMRNSYAVICLTQKKASKHSYTTK